VTRQLEQARAAFAADEATLLLWDATGTALVPVATSGLDVPAQAGFRVPMGAGFAGRVAAAEAPVLLDRVNTDTVLNPALHGRGISALLGVPVPGRPRLLGVLHVGSVAARTFTAEDVAALEHIAAQIAGEVLRRRADEEHIAALLLQRSLLPASPPHIHGLDIAARYVPADGDLGGDWYDVFRLPDDRVGVVMGDVAGHGLAAAVIMGRLRSALRSYALEHADPAEVLRLLDMKISYFEAGAFATVLYAVAAPPYTSFTVSSAGHLAPLVVGSDGVARLAEILIDPPVGVRGQWARRSTVVELAPHASLCLFTDGLIERRPVDGDAEADQLDLSLERLMAAATCGDADAACAKILTELVGDHVTEDDIALLVLRRVGEC
jgi:serine phosphatase RsbU (regulator of sigma subunit)